MARGKKKVHCFLVLICISDDDRIKITGNACTFILYLTCWTKIPWLEWFFVCVRCWWGVSLEGRERSSTRSRQQQMRQSLFILTRTASWSCALLKVRERERVRDRGRERERIKGADYCAVPLDSNLIRSFWLFELEKIWISKQFWPLKLM